ncbi:Transcriptional regulator [Streptococcus sp. ZB199]|nr:Transcriptional regulator [Streptococcus sp. ZB199]
MILKNRLKELRARDGLNQSELAKLAGVSRQSISLLERGNTPLGYHCHHHRANF